MSKYACPECGETRIAHGPARFSDWMNHRLGDNKLIKSMDATALRLGVKLRSNEKFLKRSKRFWDWLAARGLIRKYTEMRESDSTRTRALREGAAATNVTMTQYELGNSHLCFSAEKNDGSGRIVFFITVPRPRGYDQGPIEWMDDKGILKKRLAAAGLPHAQGGPARNYEEALKIFKDIGRPVVVKPYRGTRGRHTTLDVRTPEELKKAVDIALQITTEVVVERYLKGIVHRVTLVGGEPVAVARREYPHVVGDGTHTVDELIELENKQPYRNGKYFKQLDREYRVPEALKKQSLTHESIPKKGQKVILSDKNSRLHGTLTEDMTLSVHPENMELFRALGRMLGDPIVGVDFMIADVTRPWKEDPDSGYIECNAMPFIDVHHRVVAGDTINVGAYLWDVVFPPLNQKPPKERYLLFPGLE